MAASCGKLEAARRGAERRPCWPICRCPRPRALGEPYGILVTGIGGTGVITIGALLGMAAHLEGKGCTRARLHRPGAEERRGDEPCPPGAASPRICTPCGIAAGGADLLLGCDMVVAASPAALARIEHGVTHAVVNSDYQPTAAFVLNPRHRFRGRGDAARAHERRRRAATSTSSTPPGLATALMGDSIATNLFMLGYAFQKGLMPLGLEAIERAIELNGVAIELNRHAFAWGRLAAHDHARVAALARPVLAPRGAAARAA